MGLIAKLLGRSTLTDRYQTTIPADVRKQLGLKKRDHIEFLKSEDGYITLRRAEPEPVDDPEEDFSPTLLAWLDLIARDHEKHPEQFVLLDDAFFARANELVAGYEFDLDAPIEDD
jgi:antitoxin PrlF